MAGITATSPACLSSAASLQGTSLRQNSSKLCNSGDVSVPKKFEIVSQKKVQKRTQIVLKQDVPLLGKTGELLTVKRGYFRNYLYPYGKAQVASPEFLKGLRVEEEKKDAEKRRVKEEAESDALMLKSIGVLKCRRKVGKGKLIFGTVTTQDLVDIIKAQTGRDFDKRDITLPEIRETGEYVAEIKLHPESQKEFRFFKAGLGLFAEEKLVILVALQASVEIVLTALRCLRNLAESNAASVAIEAQRRYRLRKRPVLMVDVVAIYRRQRWRLPRPDHAANTDTSKSSSSRGIGAGTNDGGDVDMAIDGETATSVDMVIDAGGNKRSDRLKSTDRYSTVTKNAIASQLHEELAQKKAVSPTDSLIQGNKRMNEIMNESELTTENGGKSATNTEEAMMSTSSAAKVAVMAVGSGAELRPPQTCSWRRSRSKRRPRAYIRVHSSNKNKNTNAVVPPVVSNAHPDDVEMHAILHEMSTRFGQLISLNPNDFFAGLPEISSSESDLLINLDKMDLGPLFLGDNPLHAPPQLITYTSCMTSDQVMEVVDPTLVVVSGLSIPIGDLDLGAILS
ncbi:hypothetical protein L7F22_069127 [Adiantum nelumboides]|nr:hypothetical protein [Adiantum nelumboides]